MADAIFTPGTCLKKELYQTIINAFLAAGWQNVSSNPATDFDVLTSPGEDGDKSLTIQLRPTNTSNGNSVITTDNNVCSYRLIESYTPGSPGSAGTFGRPSEAWNNLYIVPSTSAVSMDTPMTYWLHVNKNRLIIVIETPPATGIGPVTHFIGLPDEVMVSEPGSRGLLVASSAYSKGNGVVHITNTPGELAPESTSSTRTIYCQLAPKNPNSAGRHIMSPMKYGNGSESYRGLLSDLFALPAGSGSTGDIVMEGPKKYRLIVNQNASYNSFPSTTLAIRIE